MAVTHSDSVLADESLQTTRAIANGKGGAVLHIGAGLAAVVTVVGACKYKNKHTGYITVLRPWERMTTKKEKAWLLCGNGDKDQRTLTMTENIYHIYTDSQQASLVI